MFRAQHSRPATWRGGSRPRRVAMAMAAVGVAVAAALAVVVPAGAAQAATGGEPPTIGGLTVDPVKGLDTSSVSVTTSWGCPQGTNLLAKIFGRGFPAEGQNVVGNSSISIYPASADGAMKIPLQSTIADFLRLQPGRPVLGGAYRLVVQCRNPLGPPFAQFVGSLTFTSPVAYTAQAPKTYPRPAAGPAASPGAAAVPGAAGNQGAAQGAPGGTAAGAAGGGFPNAPGSAPGAATTTASDVVQGEGGIPVPFPLLVAGLVALVGLAVLQAGRGRGNRPATASATATAGADGGRPDGTGSRRVRIDTTQLAAQKADLAERLAVPVRPAGPVAAPTVVVPVAPDAADPTSVLPATAPADR